MDADERLWLAQLGQQELGPVGLRLTELDPSFPRGSFPALAKAVATSSYLVHEVARHILCIGADSAGRSYSPLARVLLEVSECLAAGTQAVVLEVAKSGDALSASRDYVEALSIQASMLLGGEDAGEAPRDSDTSASGLTSETAPPTATITAGETGGSPGQAVAESIVLSSALDSQLRHTESEASRNQSRQVEHLYGLIQEGERQKKTLELQVQRIQHELSEARARNAALESRNTQLARRLLQPSGQENEPRPDEMDPSTRSGQSMGHLLHSGPMIRSKSAAAPRARPSAAGNISLTLTESQFVPAPPGPTRPQSRGGRQRLQTFSEVSSSYSFAQKAQNTPEATASGNPAASGTTLTASQLDTGLEVPPSGELSIDAYLARPNKVAHLDYIQPQTSPTLQQGSVAIEEGIANQVRKGIAGSRGAAITSLIGELVPRVSDGPRRPSGSDQHPDRRRSAGGPETDGHEVISVEDAAVSPTGEIMHTQKLLEATQTDHGVTAATIAAASSYVNAVTSLADDDAWRIEAAIRRRAEFKEEIAAARRGQETGVSRPGDGVILQQTGQVPGQIAFPSRGAEEPLGEFRAPLGRQATDEYYYSALTPVITSHTCSLGSVDLEALARPLPQLGEETTARYLQALDEAAPRSEALTRGLGLARITFTSPELETLSAAKQSAFLDGALFSLKKEHGMTEEEEMQARETASSALDLTCPQNAGPGGATRANDSVLPLSSVSHNRDTDGLSTGRREPFPGTDSATASRDMCFADAIAPNEPDTKAIPSDGSERRLETLEDYMHIVSSVDAVYGFRQAKLGRLLGKPCLLHPKYVLAETSILNAMLGSGSPGLTKLEMERTAEYNTIDAYNQLRDREVLNDMSSRLYCADSIFSFTTSGSLLSLKEGRVGGREAEAVDLLWCDFVARFCAEEDGVVFTEDPAFREQYSRARTVYSALNGLDPAVYLNLVNSAVAGGLNEARLEDVSSAAVEALEGRTGEAKIPTTPGIETTSRIASPILSVARETDGAEEGPAGVRTTDTAAANPSETWKDTPGTLEMPPGSASQLQVNPQLFPERLEMTRIIPPGSGTADFSLKPQEPRAAMPELVGPKTHCLGLMKKGGLYKLLSPKIKAFGEAVTPSKKEDTSAGKKEAKASSFTTRTISYISNACRAAGYVLLDLRSLLSLINDLMLQRLAFMETLPSPQEGGDPGHGYTPFWRFFVQILLRENEMDWDRTCVAAVSILFSANVYVLQDAIAGTRTYSDMLLLFLDLLNSEDPLVVEFVVWAYGAFSDFCGPRYPYPFISCEQAVLAFRSLLPNIPKPYRASLEAQLSGISLKLGGSRVVDLGVALRMLARQKAMMQVLFVNSLAEDYGQLLEGEPLGPAGGAKYGPETGLLGESARTYGGERGGTPSLGGGAASLTPGGPGTPVLSAVHLGATNSSAIGNSAISVTPARAAASARPVTPSTPETPKASLRSSRTSSPLRPKSSLGKHGKKKRGPDPIKYSRYSTVPIQCSVLRFLLERHGVIIPQPLLEEVYSSALTASAPSASAQPSSGLSPALPSIRTVLEAFVWAPRCGLLDSVLAGSPYLCLFRGRYDSPLRPNRRLAGLLTAMGGNSGEKDSIEELVELIKQIVADIERPVKTLASMLTCEGSGVSYSKGPWYVAEPGAREALARRGAVRSKKAPATEPVKGSVSPLVPSLELRGLLSAARLSGNAETSELVDKCTSYVSLGPPPTSHFLAASREDAFTFNCLAFVAEPRKAQGAFAKRLVYEYLSLKILVARMSSGSGGRRSESIGALVESLRRVFLLCQEGYGMLMPYNADSEFLLYELAAARQELVKRHAFLCGNLTEERAARMALGTTQERGKLLRILAQARNSVLFL